MRAVLEGEREDVGANWAAICSHVNGLLFWHIDIVPNRDSRPTFLLRESYRDGSRVRKRTLANLSALSTEQIAAIRAVLRGEPFRPAGELFEAVRRVGLEPL